MKKRTITLIVLLAILVILAADIRMISSVKDHAILLGFHPIGNPKLLYRPAFEIFITDQGVIFYFRNKPLLPLMCNIWKRDLKHTVRPVWHMSVCQIAGDHCRIGAFC